MKEETKSTLEDMVFGGISGVLLTIRDIATPTFWGRKAVNNIYKGICKDLVDSYPVIKASCIAGRIITWPALAGLGYGIYKIIE